MRSTFKVLFYVKKGSEKPNGNLPLMCRLTVDGEIKQFSCKMDVPLSGTDADGRICYCRQTQGCLSRYRCQAGNPAKTLRAAQHRICQESGTQQSKGNVPALCDRLQAHP